MKFSDLFDKQGFRKFSKDKYIDPRTGRKIKKEIALEWAAKREGFGSYKDLQSTTRSARYKKFAKWYEQAHGKEVTEEFNKLYKKTKAGKRGKAQVELFRATTFNPNFNKEGWWKKYL